MSSTFDLSTIVTCKAGEVAHISRWNKVIFVPTGRPLQGTRPVSAAEDQYLMTVIAAASTRFSMKPVASTSRATYTIDTLRDFAARPPGRAVLHHRRRRAGHVHLDVDDCHSRAFS